MDAINFTMLTQSANLAFCRILQVTENRAVGAQIHWGDKRFSSRFLGDKRRPIFTDGRGEPGPNEESPETIRAESRGEPEPRLSGD